MYIPYDPKKLSQEADPHQLKGGPYLELINHKRCQPLEFIKQNGGLPLDFINQKGVRLKIVPRGGPPSTKRGSTSRIHQSKAVLF